MSDNAKYIQLVQRNYEHRYWNDYNLLVKIILFRCVKCCKSVEEEVYIQRSGESLIETEGNKIKLQPNNSVHGTNNNSNQTLSKKNEELDEDGFTIVKSKKKK